MVDEQSESPRPVAPDAVTADRRPALSASRQVTIAETVTKHEATRRKVLAGGFFGALGIVTLGSLGVLAKFIWPLNVKGFGGTFVVSPDRLPLQGEDPVKVVEAKAWVVNLAPNEGTGGVGTPNPAGGMIALYQKCVHLGCTVPWLAQFDFQGQKGWFRCPCHQSTYAKAGVRVFGPAPRSLDTFDLQFDSQGRLVINTGKITLGGEDNATRAIPTASA